MPRSRKTCVYHALCVDDTALVLEGFTLPPMLGEVRNTLSFHGVVRQHLDIDRGGDNGLLLGFASLTLDSGAGVAALKDTPRGQEKGL